MSLKQIITVVAQQTQDEFNETVVAFTKSKNDDDYFVTRTINDKNCFAVPQNFAKGSAFTIKANKQGYNSFFSATTKPVVAESYGVIWLHKEKVDE